MNLQRSGFGHTFMHHMVVVGTSHTHFDHGIHPFNGISCLFVCTHICMHVVVLPVDVVVFSSRFGWWKALPVSPATSSKVQKCDCYWVGGRPNVLLLGGGVTQLHIGPGFFSGYPTISHMKGWFTP